MLPCCLFSPEAFYPILVPMNNTDPFEQFDSWYAEARDSEINDSNAMALSTATPDGHPSLRMVLLKGHGPGIEPGITGGEGGFIFYTNLESRKGGEIAKNSQVALLFHWKSLRRQIRIEGLVKPVSDATADAYFASRARESRLGAWASDQSRPLGSREIFEARYAEIDQKYAGTDEIPRPPHWTGHVVIPQKIEFWQDREFRLHERWLFERSDSGWRSGMLYP